MLKLKEIKESNIPKRSRPGYGERLAVIDEFMKSSMKACMVDIVDEKLGVKSTASSLRSAVGRLGYTGKVSIFIRNGNLYMMKRESEKTE